MKKIFTVAVIGCGNRGGDVYSEIMQQHPDRFKVVALCDINPKQLEHYSKARNVPLENCFDNEDDFFKEKRADILVVSTLDQDHVRVAIKAMKLGYDLLLEKPISARKDECDMLLKVQQETKSRVLVCHVLRYATAYIKAKELIDSGSIGKLVSVDHLERVAYWHDAHSYVRGNWRREDETAPMILAKSCHDMDLLQWYVGAPAVTISSFGSLNYFRKENQPKDASDRCLECKHMKTCPYSAYRIYIEDWYSKKCPVDSWPQSVMCRDVPLTEEKMMKELQKGPYGRCVFACDNDVVDHQVCIIKFANGVDADFRMIGETRYGGRRIDFAGTEGELVLDEHEGKLTLMQFGKDDVVWNLDELIGPEKGAHGGGDFLLVKALYEMEESGIDASTTLKESLMSHYMCFAAEESRHNNGKATEIKL